MTSHIDPVTLLQTNDGSKILTKYSPRSNDHPEATNLLLTDPRADPSSKDNAITTKWNSRCTGLVEK